jgi:Tfp pilus assembly protein PilF
MDGAPHEGTEPEAYSLFERGSGFLNQGHPAQAAMLLEKAMRLAPGKNSIVEALARAYFQIGRFDEAAQLFRSITDSVPTNDYAHFGLACSLVKLGRITEARGHFRLAAAMEPERTDYLQRLARCDSRLQRADEAASGEE